MKYILWVLPIAFPCYVIHFFLGSLISILIRPFSRKAADRWIVCFSRIFSKIVLFLLGVHVNITGSVDRIENAERICFISNHTSLLDVIVLASCMKSSIGFVAKKEISYVPVFNITALSLNTVFMNRQSLKDGVRAICKGAEKIMKGCNMVIFPEGTRSKDGNIAQFKYGSFRLATQSNATIVPITVKGLRPALEDRKHCFGRTECFFDIGPDYKTDEIKNRNDLNILAIKIENHINSVYQTLGDVKNGK